MNERRKKIMLLRYKPLFFDFTLVKFLLTVFADYTIFFFIVIYLIHFYPLFLNKYLNELFLIYLSIFALSFVILIPHFIKIGNEFKKMTGHFTWKPPKEYMEFLEQDPNNHKKWRWS